MKFDWDNRKAEANLKTHDVSFDEAQEAFFDPNAVEFYDTDHSTRTEKRYNLIGLSSRRLLFVVYTELEGPTVWIISARKAENRQENCMKKATPKPKSKTVTMVVTQKDYDHTISSGISPDEALKPGTHLGRRGGFLERHKEDMASGKIETKSGTYVKLDRDILRFFKAKAPKPSAAPDQTQINEALRVFIRGARNAS